MSFGSQTQQLLLIISLNNLNISLIPPLKIILPTLSLISPLRVYTSMCKQIGKSQTISSSSLYELLVMHLQNQQGQISLNQTLNMIYKQRNNHNKINHNKLRNSIINNNANDLQLSKLHKQNQWNFRICIIGQQIVSWQVVMKYKLKNITIDTISMNQRLSQISFATGGIYRPAISQNLIRMFLTLFSLSTKCRKYFNFNQIQNNKDDKTAIQFSVDCICCKNKQKQMKNYCILCTKCLAVHCSNMYQKCMACGQIMESIELKDKPC